MKTDCYYENGIEYHVSRIMNQGEQRYIMIIELLELIIYMNIYLKMDFGQEKRNQEIVIIMRVMVLICGI